MDTAVQDDQRRAWDAARAARPVVTLFAMRAGLRSYGADNRTVVLFENPNVGGRSPLPDTVPYAMAWLNLKAGPIVVEAPPRMVVAIQDFWGRELRTVVAQDHGPSIVLPPDVVGDVPKGYRAVQSRTYGNWLYVPATPDSTARTVAMRTVRQQLRIYPFLSAARSRFTTVRSAGTADAFVGSIASGIAYFIDVDQVVQEEPAEALDDDAADALRAIGIQKGVPFAPDARWRQILGEAA